MRSTLLCCLPSTFADSIAPRIFSTFLVVSADFLGDEDVMSDPDKPTPDYQWLEDAISQLGQAVLILFTTPFILFANLIRDLIQGEPKERDDE